MLTTKAVHAIPVVELNPEAEAQPAGNVVLTAPPVRAVRDLAPNIPSATKPTLDCQATTAALVMLPKIPSTGETPRAV